MACTRAPSPLQRTLAITILNVSDPTHRTFATLEFHFFATCERAASRVHWEQPFNTTNPNMLRLTHPINIAPHTHTTTTTTTGLVWTRAFGESSVVHTAKDEVWQHATTPHAAQASSTALVHRLLSFTTTPLPHPFLPSLPRSFRPLQLSRSQHPRCAPIVAANRAGTTSVVKGGCCTASSPTSGPRAYTRPVQLVPQRHLKPPTTHGSPDACTCTCACTCGQDCRGARGGREPAC